MTQPPSTRRRWWLGAGVAAAAAAAGVAAYRLQRPPATDAAAGSAPPTSPDEAAAALWSASFDTPQGGRLALQSLRGRPLVLNFWATWCPPCVREMPALERFYIAHRARGWQVLGVAADNGKAVGEFMSRNAISFDVVLAGFEGVEWSRRLGNLSGGLPFTVVFDSASNVVHRHMGETTYDQLTGWAAGIS